MSRGDAVIFGYLTCIGIIRKTRRLLSRKQRKATSLNSAFHCWVLSLFHQPWPKGSTKGDYTPENVMLHVLLVVST